MNPTSLISSHMHCLFVAPDNIERPKKYKTKKKYYYKSKNDTNSVIRIYRLSLPTISRNGDLADSNKAIQRD